MSDQDTFGTLKIGQCAICHGNLSQCGGVHASDPILTQIGQQIEEIQSLQSQLLASQKRVENLNDVLKIQCGQGNWNCNEYMWGMANGLILAMSIFTDNNPQYLKKPEKWLDDLPRSKPTVQGEEALSDNWQEKA